MKLHTYVPGQKIINKIKSTIENRLTSKTLMILSKDINKFCQCNLSRWFGYLMLPTPIGLLFICSGFTYKEKFLVKFRMSVSHNLLGRELTLTCTVTPLTQTN